MDIEQIQRLLGEHFVEVSHVETFEGYYRTSHNEMIPVTIKIRDEGTGVNPTDRYAAEVYDEDGTMLVGAPNYSSPADAIAALELHGLKRTMG